MKSRLLAIVMSMILVIIGSAVPVFATNDDPTSGNTFLIVIQDADGNVTFSQRITRQIYVNGTQYEISAGGKLTTYQYQPSIAFSTGFKFDKTTANRSITISLYNSASIGGTRYSVKSETVNTSTASVSISPNNDSHELYTDSISSTRPYYNGEVVNNSSSKMTVGLVVVMD